MILVSNTLVEKGETHYIYMTNKDSKSQFRVSSLKSGGGSSAFEKFHLKTMSISDYNGLYYIPVKTWRLKLTILN